MAEVLISEAEKAFIHHGVQVVLIHFLPRSLLKLDSCRMIFAAMEDPA